MGYRKNKLRRDTIERFGPTVGLPLFHGVETHGSASPQGSASPTAVARLNAAPKSMLIANETKKLGEMTAKHDELKLGDKQQKVLDVFYLGGEDWTNEEIAEKLEWGINRVVGRVFELRELGLVVPGRKRECTVTGMVVQAWRAK
jgi:hypothetical protein